MDYSFDELITKGMRSIEAGKTVTALSFFERAMELNDENPIVISFYAYCIAKERGQIRKGISMCEAILKKDPEESNHYLNLGRIYLLAGRKIDAMDIFREGLLCDENPAIVKEMDGLGLRKPPLFKSLERTHPLNKYLGLFLARLGLR